MKQQVIICVDDEAIVLDSLKEQVQQEFGDEILVEVAESGVEALEILDELIEDDMEVPIMVADFIMPDMKGDSLLYEVHRRKPEIRKIMLTGQASIEGVGNAVNKANLYRYIAKPWDRNDLMLTMREALKSFNQDGLILRQNKQLRELNIGLEEKVQERTLELQDLNATKDKFFSIIAHDLKNPFNTLMGFSELIRDNIQVYSKDQIKEYVNILFETAKSSYGLLENLLEWSRAQTGRIKMNPIEINLQEIAEDTVKLLENQAVKKNIIIHNDITEKVTAYADLNMITTVMRNLLSNSIKYTPKGGNIVLDAHKNEDKDEVIAYIKDNGVGMSENIVSKLFRIDGSVSTRGTEQESGTGLGLVLCAEFMKKNKGRIWAESTEGEGSTFSFSIPTKA